MPLVMSFSGIRGVFEKDLNQEHAVRFGYAFRTLRNLKKVVIGRDPRPSGEALAGSLREGLDCDIIDIGIATTPVTQNAVRAFNADGGIIITASHNEPEYNGFKFLDKDGGVLNAKDSAALIAEAKKYLDMPGKDFTDLLYKDREDERDIDNREEDARKHYLKFVQSIIPKEDLSGISILVDVNGGAGTYIQEVFQEYDVYARFINAELGVFEHTIEPKYEVLEEIEPFNEDFAVMFDCDADRAEIILKDGEHVNGHQILAIIVHDILANIERPQDQIVVVNDATSYVVRSL